MKNIEINGATKFKSPIKMHPQATKKVTKKAAFGARRRLEKKARRAEARAKGASPAQQAAPWQGKRAADAGKGPAKKKRGKKEGKKTFVGKRKT